MAKSNSFITLLAHPGLLALADPDTRRETVRRAAACAEWAGPDSLRFRYVLDVEFGQVRIPPPLADPARADRLWAHTCFEAFVGLGDGSPQYLELNFSPSGQWAAYRFESYRHGMAPAVLDTAPRLALRHSDSRLELEAEVRLSGSLSLSHGEPGRRAPVGGGLRIALSTVVEDGEGRLSYWALRHPPGRPDFHHPYGFSLALEFPRKQLP